MTENTNSLAGLSLDAEGVSFPAAEKRGPLVRINGKTMTEQGIKEGTILGVFRFEKTLESEKYPGQIDYAFRGAEDSLVILKGNASVKKQMSEISAGELAQITYRGTYKTAKAPGKVCHAFLIEGALKAE